MGIAACLNQRDRFTIVLSFASDESGKSLFDEFYW